MFSTLLVYVPFVHLVDFLSARYRFTGLSDADFGKFDAALRRMQGQFTRSAAFGPKLLRQTFRSAHDAAEKTAMRAHAARLQLQTS